MAWPLERGLVGPERPTMRDVEALNDVFSEAFTDRYRRDGMSGVRVPHLHPLIWRYALEDAGDGAMIWRGADRRLAAFNIVHHSGTEGWMGPLAVQPDRQSTGVGKAMLQAGIEWLRERGATTIGLETMPRTIENIGFYSRLGFLPGHLTVTVARDLPARPAGRAELLASGSAEREQQLHDARALTARLAGGTDFTREITLTRELAVGDTVLVRHAGRLSGFALWHSAPLAAGRTADEVRVLKLVAQDAAAFESVVSAVEAAAHAAGIHRVTVRCQTAYAEAYARLIARGYRVYWTDLRMTLHGYGELRPAEGVVLSNWEI